MDRTPCACGCGELARKGRRFLMGHDKRKVGPPGTSWCGACCRFLPTAEFGKDTSRWNGLNRRCFGCRKADRAPDRAKAAQRSRDYYRANRDRVLVQMADYRARNADKVAERNRRYQRERREEIAARRRNNPVDLATRRAYQEANREKRAAQSREWRQRNPERVIAYGHARRAREHLGGNYLIRDWIRLLNRHGGVCAYCETRLATVREHVIPLSRGGSNTIGNILPACQSCNASKGNKLLVEWRRWRRLAEVA